jgi:hypothetical protein
LQVQVLPGILSSERTPLGSGAAHGEPSSPETPARRVTGTILLLRKRPTQSNTALLGGDVKAVQPIATLHAADLDDPASARFNLVADDLFLDPVHLHDQLVGIDLD